MIFEANTQEELKRLGIRNDTNYNIEYLNRDYFNADQNIEKSIAKAIIADNGNISFLVADDYGMDKFIKDVKIIK